MSTEVITVCRLCSSNENLSWIFEKHFQTAVEKLQDIIFITTGVKVDSKDVVSQKICKRCLHITIKMSQFRMTALQNDKLLKEKYEVLVKNGGLKVGNTSIKMINEISSDQSYATELIVHPSVRGLRQEYPNLRVPKSLMKSDISPYVTLHLNEVENYFKLHNRNFMKHCMEVLSQRQKKFREYTKLSEPCKKLSNINSESSEKASDVVELTPSSSHNNMSILQPINIKLTKTDRTEYAIVRNNEEVETTPIKCDLKRKKSPVSHSEPSTSKKRNISESSVDCDEKGYTKGNLFEFLGLNPKANKNELKNINPKSNKNELKNEVTLEVAYVQTTLETCNICSSVQYNSKELKKHQLQHLRCQFCKNIFKTLTLKEEHLRDKCLFKETMNLPDVILNKVENDLELRREYPSAFTGFPPVKGMEMDTSIIEILSDDEENLPGTSKSHQSDVNSGSKDQKEVNDSDCQDDISDKIIKPEVKLKNYDFLDKISSTATDLEALNYLVKNYGIVKFSQDTGTQYPIPPNKIVQSETEEFSTTLKDFMDHLKAYSIPLEIKHKESYQISFNYNPPKEVTRKMCGWDDLIPTELKTSSLDDAPVTSSTSTHQTMVCVTAIPKRGRPKKLEAPEHDDTVTNIHNTSLNQQAMLPSTSKGKHETKSKNGLKTANNIISKPKKAVSVKNKATLRKIKNDILVPVNSESECNSTNVSTNGQTTLVPNINEEQKISKNEIQIDNGINNQSKIPASNTYLLPTPSSGSTSSNQHTLVSKSIDQHQVHSTQNLGPIKRILIQTKPVSSTPTNTSTATTSTIFSTKGTTLSNCVERTRIMTGDNSAIQQSLTNNNILQTSSSTSGRQHTLIINHMVQNQQNKAVRSRHNISVSQMASKTKNNCNAIDKMPVSTYLSNYKIPKISNTSISQTTSLSKYPDGNEMNTMVNASQPTYSTQVPTVVNTTKNQPTPVSHSTVGNQLNSAVKGSQSTSFNQTMTSNPIKRVILVQNSPASSTSINASGVIKTNSTYFPQSTSLSKSVHRNGIIAGVNVLQQIPTNNTQVPITLHISTSSHQQEPIPKTTTNNRYITQTSISSTPTNTSNVEVSREKSTYNKKVSKSTSPIQQNLTTNSTNGNQDINMTSIYQTMKSNPSNECSSNPNIPVSSTQTEASEILKTNDTLLTQKTSLSKCADGNKINGVVNVSKQTRVYSIVPTTLGSSTYSNQLNSISYCTDGNYTSSSVQRNNGTLFNPTTKGCILSRNIPVNSTRINESEVVKSNTTYLSQNTSLLNGAMKNEVSNKIVGYQQTYGTLLSTAEGSSNSSKQQVLSSTSTGGSQLITAVQISYKTPNNESIISSNLKNGLISNQKPPVSSCPINACEVIRGNNAFSTQKSSLSYSAEPNKMNGELDRDVTTVDAVVPETFGVQSVKKPIILKLLDRNKKKNQLQSVSLLVDKETSSNTESDSRIQGSQQTDIGKIVGNCSSKIVSASIGQDAIRTPVISDGNVPYIYNKNLCALQRMSISAPVSGHMPDHSSMNSDKTKMISPTIPNSFPQFLTKPQILSSTETLPSDKTSLCSSTERSSDSFQSTVPLSCTATVSACKTSTDVTLNNNVIDQRTIAKNFIDVKNLLALK